RPIFIAHVVLLSSSHFSLYFLAPPPALHSFPTRRSSDLFRFRACRRTRRPASLRGLWTSPCGSSFTALPGAWAGPCCGLPPTPPDRKSTRLNSSHVKISYAVFCLKKKSSNFHTLLRTRLL